MADPDGAARPALSIVIPAFDESERLGPSLERVAAHLAARGDAVEVVVVDDGSRDATAERAEEAGRRLGLRLRVLRHAPNRGKGFAVRRGMLEARGDVVLFSDADLSVPITHLERFLARIEGGADVVIGSRRLPGARIEIHQPALRERLGAWFGRLARWLVAPGVSDFTCGFKMFRREAAQEVFALQRLDGWGFDAEIVLIALRRGFVLEEEPVEWRDDRRTRVRILRDGLRSGAELLRIRWNDLRGAYRGPVTAREPKVSAG